MKPGIHTADEFTREREKERAADIRKTLVAVLSRPDNPTERFPDAARAVVAALEVTGRFYFHAELRDFADAFHYSETTHRLERVQSDAFLAWLSEWTGVNRATRLFAFIQREVETVALSEKRSTPVLPESYWTARNGAFYVSNGDGHAVKVTAEGVHLVDNGTDGVLFMAGATCAPWKLLPGGGASILERSRLFTDSNIATPEGRLLFALWLYSLPSNPKTKPVLVAVGDVGSGKTKLTKAAAVLFGIPDVTAKVEEGNEGDFWPALHAGGLFVLDNADTRCRWLPDALAAAATDGCSRRRRLYTNAENVTLRANAWCAVTSSNPAFGGDAGLADRLLVVRLERRELATADAELLAEVAANRDAALTHVVHTLRAAFADGTPTPDGLNLRHPDFASLAVRIGRALGQGDAALAALRAAESAKSGFCLENDGATAALLELLRADGSFNGSAKALAEKLGETDEGLREWLTTKKLGKRLTAVWPHLRRVCAVAERRHTEQGAWYEFQLEREPG